MQGCRVQKLVKISVDSDVAVNFPFLGDHWPPAHKGKGSSVQEELPGVSFRQTAHFIVPGIRYMRILRVMVGRAVWS